MVETSRRLLKLLSLLQTPREWPGPELARRLEVTQRTVRNDVDRLRRLGYPVEATRGRSAATGWPRAAPCRRCSSTTTRRWPSRSACARPRTAASRVGGVGPGGARQAQPGAAPAAGHPGRGAAGDRRPRLPERRSRTPRAGGRRRPADRGLRRDPATARSSASATPITTGPSPSAGSSPPGWSTSAGAGTWWPSTSTASTGAPSGSTGCARPARSCTVPPPPLPAQDLGEYVATRTRQVQQRVIGTVVVDAPADQVAARMGAGSSARSNRWARRGAGSASAAAPPTISPSGWASSAPTSRSSRTPPTWPARPGVSPSATPGPRPADPPRGHRSALTQGQPCPPTPWSMPCPCHLDGEPWRSREPAPGIVHVARRGCAKEGHAMRTTSRGRRRAAGLLGAAVLAASTACTGPSSPAPASGASSTQASQSSTGPVVRRWGRRGRCPRSRPGRPASPRRAIGRRAVHQRQRCLHRRVPRHRRRRPGAGPSDQQRPVRVDALRASPPATVTGRSRSTSTGSAPPSPPPASRPTRATTRTSSPPRSNCTSAASLA